VRALLPVSYRYIVDACDQADLATCKHCGHRDDDRRSIERCVMDVHLEGVVLLPCEL